MSNHTPGPWFSDKKGSIWRRDPKDLYQNGGAVAGDKAVAIVVKGWFHEGAEGYPVEANARLIAAAPELLEALIDALCALECCGKDYPAAEKARAAIAKARGEE